MNYKKALWYAVDDVRISFKASKKEINTLILGFFDILIALIVLAARVAIVLTFPISIPIIALIIMIEDVNARRAYEDLLARAATDSDDMWGA